MRRTKPIVYSAHAREVMQQRLLPAELVERTVQSPDWSEADPTQEDAERRFLALPERDGRVLRVAVVETESEVRIITAFLDRRARRRE